ncbi:VOC family protein [Mycobacterium sp. E740]|uniref:VOC family protein n=1 Tax=Mycobacterium sp. E740 TaxID=1834149 RepID=UPI0007FC5571|nr:VOC family protein [Mycobacterium sp. E740]OBI76532.1 biphenyl 2,3-dioxygenase [Mycobacterium sp. E740]
MGSTASRGGWAGQHANKRLAHLVLQTDQLPVLRDWYLSVLDAHVVFENDMLTFMTFDEEHHRLALVQLPDAAPRTSTTVGLAHSAYTFATLDGLLTKFEALKKAGIQPHVPVQHGLTTSLYYRDPDGNMVELQIDNMAPDDATAYMHGDDYSRDPIGPSFDPDAMLAALRAGTPEPELITRTWAMTCPQLNVFELLLT